MITIVRPNSKKRVYGILEEKSLTAVEPPLWVALLAACYRQVGGKVIVIDNEIENLPVEKLALKIALQRPRTVIIAVCGHNPSSSTQSMSGVTELIETLSLFAIQSVLYGLHPSALPEETLVRTGAYGVIVGEGFDIIRKKEPLEGIIRTQDWADLDTLPFPAWDLLPIKNYRAHNWHCFGNPDARSPYGVVYSSFGCPFSCSFCVIHAMFGGQRGVRFRSPKLVAEDIFWWIRTGTRTIRILDENFTLHKKHVSDICSHLKRLAKEEDFDLDELNMWAYASVSTVDAEMLKNLRSVGIKWLCYGFETGNDEIAHWSGKTTKSRGWADKILKAADMTFKAGIHINANWMFGFPEDSWETMQQTLHLAQIMNAEWVNMYCAMAYPGSQLYEEAKESGITLPSTWEEYSQYSANSLPLPTAYLSSMDVLAYRDYAFTTYFTNPMYLNMIETIFGNETVESIKKMTETKIRRNYER